MVRAGASLWLGVVVAVCLGWAAMEARHLEWHSLGKPPAAIPKAERSAVEASYAAIRADLDAGRAEQATLALRRRAEHGPYPGTAWFLLGEVAAAEGAHVAAVGHYRRAVEADAGVADRNAAFHSGATIETRLEALLEGPWANSRPPEIKELYYLRRRIGGGCE